MDYAQRELIVSRIKCGQTFLYIDDKFYVVRPPSLEQEYYANVLYQEARLQAELSGMMTADDILSLLIERNLWSQNDANTVDGLKSDMEKLKVGIFDSVFDMRKREVARKALKRAKAEFEKLMQKRHAYDYISSEGYAARIKNRYLISNCTYVDGVSIEVDEKLLEKLTQKIIEHRLDEADYRELARSEPWRSIWNIGKKSGGNIFGQPSLLLTDEQKNLAAWSMIYDSVYESMDCPSDEVINDDDMLDGWIILQNRKREQEKKKQQAEDRFGGKLRDADEVYLVAQNQEEADSIDSLNSPESKIVKNQRAALLKKKGKMHELEMPDVQNKLRAAIAQERSRRMKAGR